MEMVSVRYFVDDIDDVVSFYADNFNFAVKMNPGTGFAMLIRGNLRLLLNRPGAGGAGQAMPDGTYPEPGGWNRFLIEVDDIQEVVEELRNNGTRLKSEVIAGMGGKQVLVEDPAGNPVEIFQSQ